MLQDILEKIGGILVLIIIVVIALIVVTNFNNNLNAQTTTPQEAKDTATKFNTTLPKYFDWAIGLILILSIFITAWLSREVEVNSWYIIIVLIWFMIIPFIAMLLSNIYSMFNLNADVITITANMPITNFIMSHYAIYAVIFCTFVGIVYITGINRPTQ